MGLKLFYIALHVLILSLMPVFQGFAYDPEKWITVEEEFGKQDHEKMVVYLALPPGQGSVQPGQEVMGLCAWSPDIKNLKRFFEKSYASRYAQERNMAILIWGKAGGSWDARLSADELERRDRREFDRTFKDQAKAFEKIVKRMSRQYGLPEGNFLAYGASGGAQWLHRYAFRYPERFLAVHSDINSSYDKPNLEGKKTLWLFTTGTREGGYLDACRYYQVYKRAGYGIFFRSEFNTGHRTTKGNEQFGEAFFNYAKSFKEQIDANNPNPWMDEYNKPPYYGDYFNHEILPAKRAHQYPANQLVPLPTKELALLFGDLNAAKKAKKK